jgi:cystathionine beta-lyase/cystathionine gamma-synthase
MLRIDRDALLERLSDHPHVLITRYPGLASHPTHDAARRQLKGVRNDYLV